MRFAPIKEFLKSISARIAFRFCVTFAVGLAAAFSICYLQIEHSLKASDRALISAKSQEASALLQAGGIPTLNEFLAAEKNRFRNSEFLIRVMTEAGDPLFLKPSVQEKKFDFSAQFKRTVNPKTIPRWQSLQASDDEDKFDLLTEKSGTFILQVGRSSETREDVLENLSLTFLTIGIIFILLSGFLGFWYAKHALAPIRVLASTMRKIEAGELTHRVSLGGAKDELASLGETFNHMIVRIQKLLGVMTESLDNVAHDIRTPLTRIRAIAEDALLTGDSDSLKEALADCAESAAEISALVSQLLSISEAEAGTLKLNYEDSCVHEVLSEVVDIYEFVAQERQISVVVSVKPVTLCARIDRKRIKQAVANLLDNAIKFSQDGSHIFLSASVENEQLGISVRDTGVGIDKVDIDRIWDRLYRSDKSRTTIGLGLGLAIVRAVVQAHGGATRANSDGKTGSEISIHLPYVIPPP